jgi:catechol 2,3-dioxygenase-like lactoylglutathione lyase family enzyme
MSFGPICCNAAVSLRWPSARPHHSEQAVVAHYQPRVCRGCFFSDCLSAQEQQPLKIDHIPLEVVDLRKSIAFYHDLLGLEIKSQSKDFAMLQSANVGVFLFTTHWNWDEKRLTNTRPGWGMYPHFEVGGVNAMIELARKGGYRIAQEPRKYDWGTEAFVADPDGYVWTLINSLT